MQEKKIDVHAVNRVHFVPRPDGSLGFALVIETMEKGVLGFALPLSALVQIFEKLPKMFADLLRQQPISGTVVPNNLTHIYWDNLSSVLANSRVTNQVAAFKKSESPSKKSASPKVGTKKTTQNKEFAKISEHTKPAKKVAAKPAAKASASTKSAKK